MSEDFKDITEAADSRLAAMAMLRLIQGYELSDKQLNDFYHYFLARGTSVTLSVFRDWIKQAPEQAELRQLAVQWTELLGERSELSDEEAERFHHQFAERFDATAVLKQPLVIGFAERQARQAFDVALTDSKRNIRWTLHYTVAGQATLQTSIKHITVAPGDVLLLPPHAEYQLTRSDNEPTWNHFYLSFHPHTDWQHHLQWPTPLTDIGLVSIPHAERARAQGILDDLIDNSLHPSPVMHDLEANLLQQFILRCRSYFDEGQHRAGDNRIDRAKRFIEEHLSEAFTLEQVATAANVSPSRLSALFKEHTGKSVFSWRNERRLIGAANLLRSSELPIASIGMQMGFSDPTYFSRTFRQHIGCSPKQYRYQR